MKSKILIVEDNEDINIMLANALTHAGYEAQSAFTGYDGLEKIKGTNYDLVLLDIMLPYKSGDELLKELRSFSNCPVIVISAKSVVSVKIDLLKLGADDYVTKPFDLDEIVARVESQLRRFHQRRNINQELRYKDLILHTEQKRVAVNGIKIDFTAKEYLIMELLMSYKGKVFTKANLYETIWGEDFFGDDNAIKSHISNIRAKLKSANPNEEYIETVWGLGYRLFKE